MSESWLCLKVCVSDHKSSEWLGQTVMRNGGFFIFLDIKNLNAFLVDVFLSGK